MSSKQEGGKDGTNRTIVLIMAAVLGIGLSIAFYVDQPGPRTIPDEPTLEKPDVGLVMEWYNKGIRTVRLENDAGDTVAMLALQATGACQFCRKISPEDGKEGRLDSKVDELLDVFLNSAVAHDGCSPHCNCGGPYHTCRNRGGWCCTCS